MQEIVRARRQRSSAKLVLHSWKPVVLVLHSLALRQLCHPLHCPFASSAPTDALPVVLRGTQH
eukprot:3296154-Pyramimonas_sp.AAC.1